MASSSGVPEAPRPYPGIGDEVSGRSGSGSRFLRLWKIPNRKAEASGPGLIPRTSSITLPSGTSRRSDLQELLRAAEKLQRDLHYLDSSLDMLRIVEGYAVSQLSMIDRFLRGLHEIFCSETPPSASLVLQITDQLRSLDQLVSNLKYQMPSLRFLPPRIVSRMTRSPWSGGSNPYHLLGNDLQDVKVKIKKNEDFGGFTSDFRKAFEGLPSETRTCLLCFSAFPANVVIKKRLLKYWWIGEGLIKLDLYQLTTDLVLEELMSKGFVEPVLKKQKVAGFRLNPLVRLVILSLAEECKFFAFDDTGMPMEGFSTHRACLVGSDGKSERPIYRSSRGKDSKLEEAITIFNVNDSCPQLRKKWFSKLKRLKVLHLSGWPGSDGRSIEIENPQFLRGIEGMKDLQLLSLQGISGIVELPDSISELSNLKILDLQACHNLAKLPPKLDKLQQLTHLDISGCYWLDHVPKEVAQLSELRVLKGFVVGRTSREGFCSLHHLVKLKKMRKLHINTGGGNFPGEDDLFHLRMFQDLEKLTISWGNSSSKDAGDHSHKPAGTHSSNKGESDHQGDNEARHHHPENDESNTGHLKKLEMQGFLGIALPPWATGGRLMPLDKLNIRGGNLYKLSESSLPIRILSLKFLGELEMDWRELKTSFPKLVYLEKVRCPKLKFFPCNEAGFWIKEEAEEKDLTGLGLPWSFLGRAA